MNAFVADFEEASVSDLVRAGLRYGEARTALTERLGRPWRVIVFAVAGATYHQHEIASYAGSDEPPDVALELEPTNHVDPLAIKIVGGRDGGVHFGFVPRPLNEAVHEAATNGRLQVVALGVGQAFEDGRQGMKVALLETGEPDEAPAFESGSISFWERKLPRANRSRA